MIGDDGRGVFVRPGIPEFFRDRCVPAADILTPNQFELEWLTGAEARTRETLLAAARALIARGPRIVFVTSLAVEDTPEDAIDVVAVDASRAVRVRVPRLPIVGRGTGDAIAALFLAHVLAGRDAAEAAARAASSLHGVLRATVAAGAAGDGADPSPGPARRPRPSVPR
ncbi:MAG: PfkB family carbohydrate kinase [Acetobacteraceae bacterium]|nr:PfkB family carbohydrate kinase [Acetobacteraceae bacterium]